MPFKSGDDVTALMGGGSAKPKAGDDVTSLMGGGEEQPSTKVEGSATSRFVKGAAANLNPLGALEALAHPIDTVGNLITAHVEQAKKAKQAYDEGRYSEAVGHLGAAALPVLGPAAAAAGEKIGEGEDIAGGLGEGVGLIGSVFTPKLVKGAAKATAAVGKAAGPMLAKAAPAVVKHGATAAGAYLGGTPGAILGASVGEEFAGRLRAAPAPVVVPEAMPARPIGPVEPPLEFTRRLKRQAMEAAGGEQAAKEAVYGPPEPTAAPQAQAPAPAPVVAPAPAQPAVALSEGPKAKLLDPDYAKSAQRMKSELGIQARRLGVKLTDEQLQTGVEAIKQGARPDAVARGFGGSEVAPVATKVAPKAAAVAIEEGPPPDHVRLYRTEPKEFSDNSWLKKHLTKAQWEKAQSERGRLFTDDPIKAKDYGFGGPDHNSYVLDVPTVVAEAAKRAHPEGWTEYLLGAEDVAKKRLMAPDPVDPAAALAAKLGTPTPEMVAARVAERNRTGRWSGAPSGKQILARANPPN